MREIASRPRRQKQRLLPRRKSPKRLNPPRQLLLSQL